MGTDISEINFFFLRQVIISNGNILNLLNIFYLGSYRLTSLDVIIVIKFYIQYYLK